MDFPHDKNIIKFYHVAQNDTYETIRDVVHNSKYTYCELRDVVSYLKSLLIVSSEAYITSVSARLYSYRSGSELACPIQPQHKWAVLTIWREIPTVYAEPVDNSWTSFSDD